VATKCLIGHVKVARGQEIAREVRLGVEEGHPMNQLSAKRALVLCVVSGLAVLSLAEQLVAQGRGPGSLQPDPTAVFITVALHHDIPVARGNILLLSSPAGHGRVTARSSGGASAAITPSVTASALNVGTSSYSVGSTYTPTTSQPEAEEEIAADPSDTSGQNLVSAISDFSQPSGFNFTKWTLSSTGGASWSENFVPFNSSTGLLVTSDGRSWNANSDPVVAFDRTGNVFLSDLYIAVDSLGRITSEGLYVSTDTFSHLQPPSGNFGHTYRIRANLNNTKTFSFEDKPWITVDNSGTATAGYVYASWSHFTGCQNKYSIFIGYYLTCSSDVLWVAYSKDHGQTWSTPITINPSGQNGALQGSQVAVGPNGKVYVAYELFGSGAQRQQYLSVGTWSGSTLSTLAFSAPFAVTPAFSELNFAGCSNCTASYRVNSFPSLAVGPGGNVYLVYGGQANSTSTAQVYFVSCTSSCTSSSAFAAPGIVNDNPAGDHFFPAIAVGPSGVINTSWFDSRNNPSNPDYLDIYAAFLTYDGVTKSFTLSPNARVTPSTMDASISDLFGDTGFIGDYAGIAATAANTAHPVWTNASGLLGYLISGSLQTATLTP